MESIIYECIEFSACLSRAIFFLHIKYVSCLYLFAISSVSDF